MKFFLSFNTLILFAYITDSLGNIDSPILFIATVITNIIFLTLILNKELIKGKNILYLLAIAGVSIFLGTLLFQQEYSQFNSLWKKLIIDGLLITRIYILVMFASIIFNNLAKIISGRLILKQER